jgi:hypothetical protein
MNYLDDVCQERVVVGTFEVDRVSIGVFWD